MSTGGVSSCNSSFATYQPSSQSGRSQRQQDFQNLASALQNNDLSGAQTAFAALQKVLPKAIAGQQSGKSSSAGNPAAADFQNLSQALSTGDLSAAQTAFAKLQQDLPGSRASGHHRHHHSGGSPAATMSVSSASATSTDLDSQHPLNIQA